jgi:Double zinc ribbon
VTCPQCTFENPLAMAFCGRCGTRLALLCPSCGFGNPEGFALCGRCCGRVAEAPALYGALGLTCLYALCRDFLRAFATRRRAGNRPVERSAGNPHATFVRGTEAPR